jgi:hypothetical protein
MATADFTPSPSFSTASTLQTNLQRIATRRHGVNLFVEVARALTWGLGVAVLMILAYRFYLVDGAVWLPTLPIFSSLFFGWYRGRLCRGSDLEVAIEADGILGWKDQLSSAFAFVRPDACVALTEFVPALVRDAAERSQTIEPKALYPLRFDGAHRVLALMTALFIVAVLMPNVPWLLSTAQQSQRRVIAEQGKALVAVAKEVKKEEPKATEETSEGRRLAKRIEALGHKMMRGRMDKKEALTALGTLKKDLEQATKNDGQNQDAGSDLKSMQQALQQLADQPMESASGKQLQEALKKNDADAAAKELEKLADKMEAGALSQSEKRQAANDLQKMAKSLKEQGSAQNEKLAQQLEQAAKALQQQVQQKSGQQQQQNKNGQGQQGQSGNTQQKHKQGSGQGAGSALRQMAKSLQQGGSASNSQSLQKMLNKIREAERDTGSNGSGQSGAQFKNAKNGSGNCPNGNCNEGLTPGKDLKASDPHSAVNGGAGLGPRNHAQGSKSGGGVSKDRMKRTGDKRRWEDVWSDRLPATHKRIDRVQGKYSDGGEMEQLPTKTEAKGGPVKTPYYEVYESYKKDAEDAVNKDTVPPAYKQPVKDYFESIKPN